MAWPTIGSWTNKHLLARIYIFFPLILGRSLTCRCPSDTLHSLLLLLCTHCLVVTFKAPNNIQTSKIDPLGTFKQKILHMLDFLWCEYKKNLSKVLGAKTVLIFFIADNFHPKLIIISLLHDPVLPPLLFYHPFCCYYNIYNSSWLLSLVEISVHNCK